jgi:serine/threonine-protein phosphatase 6 regulatory ankyrin repeat subunit B
MESKSLKKNALFAFITALAITACGQSPTEIALERQSEEAVAKRKAALIVEQNISDDDIEECDFNDGLQNAFINDDASYLEKNVTNQQCFVDDEKPLLNAAIFLGREKMVDFLLKNKVKDSPYFPAASEAAETHQLVMLKKLQANGYSLTAKDIGLTTPLEKALNEKSKNNQKHFEEIGSEMGIKNVPSPSSPISVIKYLVEHGADPQDRNRHGATPLMIARDLEVTQFLLEQGAYVDAVDDKGFTVAMNKIRRDSDENIKILKRILEHNPKLNQANKDDKRTALHWAASYENVNLVQLLLVNGADASIQDSKGKTPLMIAKETRNQALVVLLSGKTKTEGKSKSKTSISAENQFAEKQVKAKPIKSRNNKNQPINNELFETLKKDLYAHSKNNKCDNPRKVQGALKKDDIDYIKKNVTNFSCSIGKDGITPMLAAIALNAPKSIDYLLPLTKDNTYLPAAVFASMNLDLTLLKTLNKYNFPIDAYMIDGNNAAHTAVKADFKRLSRKSKNTYPTITVLKFLKENGTNLNGANYRGKTPLMLASKPEVLVFLLENGADVNAVDDSGKTALHYLANRGSEKSVEVLLWYKADPKIQDDKGQSVIDLMTENEKRYTGSSKQGAKKILELLNGTKKPRKPNYDPNKVTCSESNKLGEAIEDDDVDYLKNSVSDYDCRIEREIGLLFIANLYYSEKSFEFLASKVKDDDILPAMTLAAKSLSIDFLKMLLKNNFDVNKKDKDGKTALLIAADKSTTTKQGISKKKQSDTPLAVVTFLVENGADIFAKDNKGRNAIAYADSIEVFHYLFELGVSVKSKDNQGLTALHNYDEQHWNSRSTNYIKAAIAKGIDIDLPSADGNTILHQSIQRRDVDDFTDYIELGANWLVKNNEGETPLDLAEDSIAQDKIISSSDKNALIELIADLKTRKPLVKKAISSNNSKKGIENNSLNDFEKNLNNFKVSDEDMSRFYYKNWMTIHSKYKKEESKPIKDKLSRSYESWKKNKREYRKKNGTLKNNQLSMEEIDFNNKIATLETDVGSMLNAFNDAIESIGRNSNYSKEEREAKQQKMRQQFYEEWIIQKNTLLEKSKAKKDEKNKKQSKVEKIEVTGERL